MSVVNDARSKLDAGDFSAAESMLRDHLEESADDVAARALLAATLLSQGETAAARDEVSSVNAQAPKFGYAWYLRSVAAMKLGELDEADEAIRCAITGDPREPDFQAHHAEVFLLQREWEEALHAAERALALDREHVDATNVAAMARQRLGYEDPEGVDTLGSALERDPDNAETHANLGFQHLERDEFREAQEYFLRALEITPGMPVARLGYVETLKLENPIYRRLFLFNRWIEDSGRMAAMAIIIGGWLAYRSLLAEVEANPASKYWVYPLIALYIAFVILSWSGDVVFDLLVWLKSKGRKAMLPEQRLRAASFGAALALGAVATGLGLGLGVRQLMMVGVLTAIFAIPLAHCFDLEGTPAIVLRGLAVIIALLILGVGLGGAAPGLFFILSIWGILGFLLLANVFSLTSSD